MTNSMNGLRIKTKLVLIILAGSVVSLLLATGSFMVYERSRAQEEMITNLRSLARVIADRSSAAILFDDDQVASETLSALSVDRTIVAAAIYNEGGAVLARYDSGEERQFSFPQSIELQASANMSDGYLHLIEPVIVDALPVGSVFIRASLRELTVLWQSFLLFSVMILAVTILITLALASRLQRLISQPLETLTLTAENVTSQKNYSLRANRSSDDEIGSLVNAFNSMLDTIESRNLELTSANQRLASNEELLRSSNEELEQRVEVRTSELQALLNTATIGIVLMKDRHIANCNARLDEIMGYERGEQIGKLTRIWYLTDSDWVEVGREAYEDVIWKGDTYMREIELARKDGSRFWARLSARAIDVTQRDLGVVMLVEDISKERETLEEMRKARQMAEEATRMKSDFLANMSHEIRTPMNAIIGMLYLALKTELSPRQENYLTKAQGAAQSLLGIINDILDFSKIESGRLQMESIEFTLDAVLERLQDAVAYQAEHKGLEFLVRYDVNIPPTLIGDPLRLGQILLNLASNAVKFTEQGEIELTFQCLKGSDTDVTLQISVRDTGIGMPLEVQNKLFEKFSQADQSTTRKFGGTGLGLAICKHLVELMGGRIWIEDSLPGKGTTISCTAQLKVAPQAIQHRRQLLEQVGPLLKGIRVLVVDDNQVSREILAEMLRYFQLDVVGASDGEAAIDLLEKSVESPFDLVLMDWRMPGMNGDIVTRRIHSNPAITRRPKVIMVTAYGREDVMELAEKAGVAGFLTKPVSPSTLLDTLLTVLGRGKVLGSDTTKLRKEKVATLDLGGTRLLLVEDNDINREFAMELLDSMNIMVDSAINGAEAVAMVQKQNYDGVLMDIQMPVMDGLEAAKCIRALAAQPENVRFATLPIIAMTALAMAKDADNSKAAGMNDHITKPIAPDRLMATLAKWIKPPVKQHRTVHPISAAGSKPCPPELLSLSSLQVEQGIKRIGGKVDAYIRQLKRFREHYADAEQILRRMLSAQELSAARDYCHTLKGVVGNIGATALFACINDLDATLKRGEEPTDAQIQLMQSLLATVMNDIDGLAIPVAAATLHGQPLDGKQLNALVDRLQSALESDLGAAETVLMELRSGVVGTVLEDRVTKIAELVDRFDIEETQRQLAALKSSVQGTP